MTNMTPHCQTCRCGSVTLATQASLERDNFTIDRWLSLNVRLDAPDTVRLYRRHLARAFEAWCEGDGETDPPSARALYARLRRLGHQEVKIRGNFYFQGIEILAGQVDVRSERDRQEAEDAAELAEIQAAAATVGSPKAEPALASVT